MGDQHPFMTIRSRRPADDGSSTSGDSTYGSSPPSATHDTSRVNFHLKDLSVFAKTLEDSATRAFPNRGRSTQRYKKVHALLLHWRSDDLFVLPELEDLRTCLSQDYGFDTDTFAIPSDNSHLELMLKLGAMIKEHEGNDTLLMVYYGGHAKIDESRQSTWCATRSSNSPWLQWSAIQTLLERSVSDTLILLDCCAGAASATFSNSKSITETISASSWDAIAPDPGRYSFTNALIEVLSEWRTRTFSAAMLHAEVLARLKHPRPITINGKHFEARATPVHFMMTSDHRAPSIEMTRVVSQEEVMLRNRTPSPLQGRFQPQHNPQLHHQLLPPLPGSSREAAGPNSAGDQQQQQQQMVAPGQQQQLPPQTDQQLADQLQAEAQLMHVPPTPSDVLEPGEGVPHVMLTLALEGDQKLDLGQWEEWLANFPAMAKYVKVQGVFKSHSTLLLVSLPVMIWDLLPENLACNFVAFIRSNNLMVDSPSPPTPESTHATVAASSSMTAPAGPAPSAATAELLQSQRAATAPQPQPQRAVAPSVRPSPTMPLPMPMPTSMPMPMPMHMPQQSAQPIYGTPFRDPFSAARLPPPAPYGNQDTESIHSTLTGTTFVPPDSLHGSERLSGAGVLVPGGGGNSNSSSSNNQLLNMQQHQQQHYIMGPPPPPLAHRIPVPSPAAVNRNPQSMFRRVQPVGVPSASGAAAAASSSSAALAAPPPASKPSAPPLALSGPSAPPPPPQQLNRQHTDPSSLHSSPSSSSLRRGEDAIGRTMILNQTRSFRRTPFAPDHDLPDGPRLAGHVEQRLEDYFQRDAYPTVAVKEFLASNLGIETRDLDLWFYHRHQRQQMTYQLQNLRIEDQRHESAPADSPRMILPGHLNKLLQIFPPSQVLLVDLRSAVDFHKSHVHGAVNLRAPALFVANATLEQLASAMADDESRRSFGRWHSARCVVLYDRVVEFAWECPVAEALLARLRGRGWPGQAFVLKGHYREFSASFDKYISGERMSQAAKDHADGLRERPSQSAADPDDQRQQASYAEWLRLLEAEDRVPATSKLVPVKKAERARAVQADQVELELEFEHTFPQQWRAMLATLPPRSRPDTTTARPDEDDADDEEDDVAREKRRMMRRARQAMQAAQQHHQQHAREKAGGMHGGPDDDGLGKGKGYDMGYDDDARFDISQAHLVEHLSAGLEKMQEAAMSSSTAESLAPDSAGGGLGLGGRSPAGQNRIPSLLDTGSSRSNSEAVPAYSPAAGNAHHHAATGTTATTTSTTTSTTSAAAGGAGAMMDSLYPYGSDGYNKLADLDMAGPDVPSPAGATNDAAAGSLASPESKSAAGDEYDFVDSGDELGEKTPPYEARANNAGGRYPAPQQQGMTMQQHQQQHQQQQQQMQQMQMQQHQQQYGGDPGATGGQGEARRAQGKGRNIFGRMLRTAR